LHVRFFIEGDLDGYPLDYLDIIAGRVLRGQQAEGCPAPGLNAIDMSRKASSKSINHDLDSLAYLDVGELSFLEVRRYPDVKRNENHDTLCLSGQLSHGCRQPSNSAVCGCAELRSREVGVGCRLLRLRLPKLSLRVLPLRSENGDLPFSDHLGRLCRGERCCRRLKFRNRLLSPLHGTRAFCDKVLKTRVLLLGKLERRLSLDYLRLNLRDLRLLRIDLRRKIIDVRLRLIDLSLRKIDSCAVVAVVNLDKKVAHLDDLVIGNWHCNNIAGHLEIYVYRSPVDEGVVGVRIVATVKIPNSAPDRPGDNCDRADCDSDRMSTQLSDYPFVVLFWPCCADASVYSRLGLAFVGVFLRDFHLGPPYVFFIGRIVCAAPRFFRCDRSRFSLDVRLAFLTNRRRDWISLHAFLDLEASAFERVVPPNPWSLI
jgi:hypothetical protein